MYNAASWNHILIQCGVKPFTAAIWSPYFAEAIQDDTFSLGKAEIDDFVGNVLHESNRLEKMEESLFYSTPGRLMAVWPTRFPDLASETGYLRNPQALANKVYGGRGGNTGAYDGWLYRGSGPLGVTFKNNFAALEKATGLPLVAEPDLLRKPGVAPLKVCIAWWEGNVPDSVMHDKRKVRRAVNGGFIGFDDVAALTNSAGNALG